MDKDHQNVVDDCERGDSDAQTLEINNQTNSDKNVVSD
jgi:hypothetical protein